MACVLQVSFLERGISRHVFASVDVCVWQGGLAPNMRSPSFSFRKGKLSPICLLLWMLVCGRGLASNMRTSSFLFRKGKLSPIVLPLWMLVCGKRTGSRHAYFKFSF